MYSVAIIGASGMIGSHLKALLEYKEIDILDISRQIWDLSEWKTDLELDNIFKQTKYIFHFGAMLPAKNNDIYQELFDINVRSCLNLSKWAIQRDVTIIYLSSSTVYDNPHAKNILESDKKVTYGLGGFYGYTKLLSENIFSHFVAQGLKLCVLRPTSVYGLGLGDNNLISSMIIKASKDETIRLSQKNNKINFIHSMDVAYASYQVFRNNIYGVFNIADNSLTSVFDIASNVTSILNSGSIVCENNGEKSFERFDLNCNYAKKKFNFKAKIDIKEGINSMIANSMLLDKYK